MIKTAQIRKQLKARLDFDFWVDGRPKDWLPGSMFSVGARYSSADRRDAIIGALVELGWRGECTGQRCTSGEFTVDAYPSEEI